MKAPVIMLMLLGCDCDGAACRYIDTVSTDWPSMESCQSAVEARMPIPENAAYPLVIAQCAVENAPADAPPVASAAHGRDRNGWIASLDGVRDHVALLSGHAIASALSTITARLGHETSIGK